MWIKLISPAVTRRPMDSDWKTHMAPPLALLVNASMVFGFDEDTPDVFPDTLNWLLRNRVSSMTAHILTPYPGTVLHSQLAAEGRIFDRDYEHYNTAHAVFRPARMSAMELELGHRWMYRQFYSWMGIARRNLSRLAKRVAYGGEPALPAGRPLRGRQDYAGGLVAPALLKS